ncbi:MAG: membrane protein insertase YidC [Ktedonobacteraceae bacterium]|nr:membrane protein insertase YidC [Ktedonobacteraceae bacterium]
MGEIGNLFNLIFTFPIFNGLVVLYHLFGDFALSIVVLTLIIKLVLFPLTLQQLKSMKANQALQPMMQEIRKKYASDQQAQMQATQALYKEYGVNPLSGCLPLVIQLPVLYGLYYALSTVVRTSNLRDVNAHIYPFIPHFVKFPDLTFRWFEWLSFLNPLLGLHLSWTFPLNYPDPSHVLPIVAGLATFVQLRMSQPNQAAAAAASSKVKAGQPDPTAQTMKTMQYIMPLFTVFIGWSFPAGLALYWTISSLFQAVQQYFVTGWGSLLTGTPTLTKKEVVSSPSRVAASNGSTNGTAKGKVVDAVPSTARRSNQTTKVTPASREIVEADEDDEESEDERGPIEEKLRTTPRPAGSGPSQYTRRQRGGSASARRRGGAQRSRR